MKRCWMGAMALAVGVAATSGAARLDTISKDPYIGAIVVNAADGRVLFEDQADAPGYPASMLKLMDLLLVLERVEQGGLKLDEVITISGDVSKIGGSQVFLAEKERFPVDELLYALMIQSANDAAAALAIHLGGTKEGFVQMMNERAKSLGMESTRFESVHGLPPATGQKPDVTTARDFARLCVELLKRPDVTRYTSVRERGFRDGKFQMQTHNSLLGTFAGCDGLKTGYYTAGGYSIAATAQRDGVRVIAVILGSVNKQVRDAKARELLTRGLMALPKQAPAPAPVAGSVTNRPVPPAPAAPAVQPPPPASEPQKKPGKLKWYILGGILLVLLSLFRFYQRQQWGR